MTSTRQRRRIRLAAALAMVFCASAARASSLDSGDAGWVLTSAALVLLMTIPGLSLFYGGLVRSVNVLSVLMQCFAITCIVTVLWVVVGYSLAFGEGGPLIGDFSRVLFIGVDGDALIGTVPEPGFAIFQLTFAIITPALIVGGFAERMRFSAAVLFAALWSMLVYVPIAHWVWGGGWLDELGLMDAAGGTVVHVAAGAAALVAAVVIGPRHGFPDSIERPHNMTLTVAGAGLLWVGWFGFNGGSALAANGDAAMALTVTHIAAATAALSWMLLEWARYGKPSALGAVTGMVAGLGTITPASAFVSPAAALLIGAVAGTVCFLATNLMNLKLRIDDSLDVFPVHAVGGGLGTILTAVFAGSALGILGGTEDIRILGQLRVQAIGVLAVAVYTTAVTYLILRLTNRLVGNRVSEDDEIQGLDLVSHDESGYAL
ncbi:MAG: ammonium transporter [Gammaproteobacteria bacterium]|nr:ammonium transporter [Gammaproteobacteria bacterium]